MFSNNGDKRVAPADPRRKCVDEINAGRDAVHVEKDVLASQRSPQAVIYPAGEPTGVLPTVGNENPAKHGFSLRSRKLNAAAAMPLRSTELPPCARTAPPPSKATP